MLKHGATGLALEGAAKGAPKDAANVRPCAATKAVAVLAHEGALSADLLRVHGEGKGLVGDLLGGDLSETAAKPLDFASLLIDWQLVHGRHHLPWQQTREPYRVWLSEIMLQQTQVSTVVAYYERFLQQFPDVLALANAQQDAVLALWSGLGYYSRARNLHRCAQVVRDVYGGVFPSTAATLQTLPGIGPSTAAAVAAFCFGQRVSIFDANVQRVLARLLAYGDDLSRQAHVRALWQLAAGLLPLQEQREKQEDKQEETQGEQQGTHKEKHACMVAYTQGLMDLGATVCMPRNPLCGQCPVRALCRACAQGAPLAYPVKSSKLKRTAENWWLLALHRPASGHVSGDFWFEKRPQTGIWAGLYCLPVFAAGADEARLRTAIGNLPERVCTWHAPFKHVLTHKDLYLHVVSVQLAAGADLPAALVALLDDRAGTGVGAGITGAAGAGTGTGTGSGTGTGTGAWHSQWQQLGLPAPVRKWLDGLKM